MTFIKHPSKEFWRTLLVSTVVGAAAGALGALAVWSSLLSYQASLITPNTVNSATYRRRSIVVEDELLQSLRENASLLVADIFLAKADPEARYLPSEVIGHGVILTNDGWVMTHRSVLDPKRKTTFRVGVGAVLVPIDQIIEDLETGTLFLKIKAENLHAAVFGTSDELQSGDRLYLIDDNQRLRVERVDATHLHTSSPTFSDALDIKLSLIPTNPAWFAGTPVLNIHGEVVGISTIDVAGQISTIVPSDQITPLFTSLFSKGTLSRPSLGVHGVFLAGSRTAQGRERGFLIAADDRTGARAIERGSAAERAGLHAGDIVLKVNETLLNEGQEISETLLAHKPGEEVNLTVVRDNKELVVKVTLGQRESGKVY